MAKRSSSKKAALSVLLGLLIVAVFASVIWWVNQNNDQLYVGLTKNEAYARAESEGKEVRVVNIDGEYIPVSMDYRPGRLNLHIVDGVVDSVDVEGE